MYGPVLVAIKALLLQLGGAQCYESEQHIVGVTPEPDALAQGRTKAAATGAAVALVASRQAELLDEIWVILRELGIVIRVVGDSVSRTGQRAKIAARRIALMESQLGVCVTETVPAQTYRCGYVHLRNAAADHPEIQVAITRVIDACRSSSSTGISSWCDWPNELSSVRKMVP